MNTVAAPMCACGRQLLPPNPLANFTGIPYATRCTLCEAEGQDVPLRESDKDRNERLVREGIEYNERERMRMLKERGEIPIVRSCRVCAQLTLIQATAKVEQAQIGYWSDLRYDQGAESTYKLQRIINTQNAKVRTALAEWGREQGIA